MSVRKRLPFVSSVPGVNRDFVCPRCGATATDRWRNGEHAGTGDFGPCFKHPTDPGRGPHGYVEASTGLPLGEWQYAAGLAVAPDGASS